MAVKRYTDGQAVVLLTRVVNVGEASMTDAARRRRVLVALLKARLGDVVVVGTAPEMVRTAQAEEVEHYWRQLLGLLRIMAGARAHRISPSVVLNKLRVTISADDTRLEVAGGLSELLALQAATLVRATGHRLRRCKCGRLFVRTGRREFCSKRCQKRIYMKRFRAGKAGKEST